MLYSFSDINLFIHDSSGAALCNKLSPGKTVDFQKIELLVLCLQPNFSQLLKLMQCCSIHVAKQKAKHLSGGVNT